jgi:cytoskeletal protein CcmA (bactofilin family)
MANGASIVVKGRIAASEDLVVAGRVEGDIHMDAGVLTLAHGSQVIGEIAAPAAVVNGQVEGNVTVTERLDVRATAVVRGNLTSPALVVADGAQVTGRLEMPVGKRVAPLKFPVAV